MISLPYTIIIFNQIIDIYITKLAFLAVCFDRVTDWSCGHAYI